MVAVGGERATLPDSAGSSPARVRSSVDLPAPLTPTSPTTSPGAATRSRSENRTRAPCPAARPRATRVALKRTPGGTGRTDRRRSPAREHGPTIPGRAAGSPAVFVVVPGEDVVGHLVEHLLEGVVLLPRRTTAEQPRLQVVVAAHRDPLERPHPVLRPAAQPPGQLAVDQHRRGRGHRGQPAGQV